MRRLRKSIYLRLFIGIVAVLFVIRRTCPSVVVPVCEENVQVTEKEDPLPQKIVEEETPMPQKIVEKVDSSSYHPIRGVHSYQSCFPDVQEVQVRAARKWGVSPVANRAASLKRKSELVCVANSPYFEVDSLKHSIPYLVPRASALLQTIGHDFLDSLYVKGIPLHRIVVSSILRTEADVQRLSRINGNASEQSCHRFGTTFDIAYNRYSTVQDPDGPKRRTVQNDTLKWVLSEVLRDARQRGQCYVKYEAKQGCFHITVR